MGTPMQPFRRREGIGYLIKPSSGRIGTLAMIAVIAALRLAGLAR